MTEAVAEEREIGGRRVRVTHPGRVLWPAAGFTKRAMIDYDLAIAPVLLRYLHGRPVMLWRFPEGVDGPGWFQANCRGAPDWLPVHEVRGVRGDLLRYCLIEEPAALAWLANLGTIEFHAFIGTAARPDEPTALVLDLDPGPPASLVECCRVALLVRERLAGFGLRPVAKTSGSLGLHVFVGLAPGHTFGHTKAFARGIARELARREPALLVDRASRAERTGRVWIDWIQNDANRQIVAPYSLRATPLPAASTPVSWAEVGAVAQSGDQRSLRFTPAEVLDRVARHGDLFAPVVAGDGRLPESD